jgi:Ras-related protein Rab-11A
MDLTNSIAELSLVDFKSSSNENYCFKIVLVGDSSVGKSNILSRYVNNEFYKESKSTLGIELSTKVFKVNNSIIKVNIWDTAGEERYNSITAAYYKGANGAIIVYDVTKKETFDNVEKWYKEIKLISEKNLSLILVGNKSDLNLLRRVDFNDGVDKAKILSKNLILLQKYPT